MYSHGQMKCGHENMNQDTLVNAVNVCSIQLNSATFAMLARHAWGQRIDFRLLIVCIGLGAARGVIFCFRAHFYLASLRRRFYSAVVVVLDFLRDVYS